MNSTRTILIPYRNNAQLQSGMMAASRTLIRERPAELTLFHLPGETFDEPFVLAIRGIYGRSACHPLHLHLATAVADSEDAIKAYNQKHDIDFVVIPWCTHLTPELLGEPYEITPYATIVRCLKQTQLMQLLTDTGQEHCLLH
ncbi:MAG: hypothetical protein H6658_01235 [Ardenticatenaceae bacterium]|nr:hypothetical protein [Ardenticatenaceae bacterium]